MWKDVGGNHRMKRTSPSLTSQTNKEKYLPSFSESILCMWVVKLSVRQICLVYIRPPVWSLTPQTKQNSRAHKSNIPLYIIHLCLIPDRTLKTVIGNCVCLSPTLAALNQSWEAWMDIFMLQVDNILRKEARWREFLRTTESHWEAKFRIFLTPYKLSVPNP